MAHYSDACVRFHLAFLTSQSTAQCKLYAVHKSDVSNNNHTFGKFRLKVTTFRGDCQQLSAFLTDVTSRKLYLLPLIDFAIIFLAVFLQSVEKCLLSRPCLARNFFGAYSKGNFYAL